MTISQLIKKLKASKDTQHIVHHEELKPKKATYGELKDPMPEKLTKALASLGIGRLYSHQCMGIEAARAGQNVVLMTPTASGKSAVYNVPVLETIIKDPGARALYIFPLKGLEQDQLKKVQALAKSIGLKNAAEIYDGDTSQYRRGKIRKDPPSILITNPDMLHLGILAFHAKWEQFFSNLKYVVIDELHSYRGVLGSHMAELLRRLRRIASFYGSEPVFITCSATISNPEALAEDLTGLKFESITETGAPIGKRHFLFINPIPEKSPYTTATKIFSEAIKGGLRTIAFTRSRKITELLNSWFQSSNPELADTVSSYRAGYLPEERRDIEERLFSGELKGVISTSALELGVDIGGLDICILVGYPGTISSTWQRAGRVGRSGKESLIILIAVEDSLDQYFMRNPEDFFRRSVESAVLDFTNHQILRSHLLCAVAERPVSVKENIFERETALPILDELQEDGLIWWSKIKETYNPKKRYPHREVNLRGTGDVYRIIEEGSGLLGVSGSTRVLKELHPGAVYLHRGTHYLIKSIHMGTKEVLCERAELDYFTTPITDEDTEILGKEEKKKEEGFELSYGRLRITENILGFRKKDTRTRKVISEHTLELPPEVFETKGIWIEVDDDIIEEILECKFGIAGSLHALEHAMIAALPLYALCDRRDLGGVSYTLNLELGVPAIFVYDAYAGGIGLTGRGFDIARHLFESTLNLMSECPCEISCPSCTQDPHCGNNNEPLDKRGACLILKRWLRKT